jgi:hypothetical protein
MLSPSLISKSVITLPSSLPMLLKIVMARIEVLAELDKVKLNKTVLNLTLLLIWIPKE